MIPRTLQIKNFLSYGPDIQTVSFEPHHLICLSGKNGHGKSALLDAMTWALWGIARKITNAVRADQGLLHLGQTHMMVIFDFEVHKTSYRIKRCYEIVYGKPYTTLEFGIINQDQTLTPLTDKTLRTTQACIDTTIGLDFDTFVNSAFLRQGNANEFSKRSPKDRKEIITSILGLGIYDQLRKAAHDKVKEAHIHKATLNALQEKLSKELEQTAPIASQKLELDSQLIACTAHINNLTLALEACELQKHEIAQQEKKKAACELTLHQYNETIAQLTEELRSVRTAWRTAHYAQMRYTDPQSLATRKQVLAQMIEHSLSMQQQSLSLKEDILTTREAMQSCSHKLEKHMHEEQRATLITLERVKGEYTATCATIDRLEKEYRDYTIQHRECDDAIAKITVELLTQPLAHQDLSREKAVFEKRKDTYQRLATIGNMFRNELSTLQQKMALTHDKEDPSCPLCEQSLSANRRRFLESKLTTQAQMLTHRCDRLKRVLPKLKLILITQHETLQVLQQKVDFYATLQNSRDTMTHKLQEIRSKEEETKRLIAHEEQKKQSLHDAIQLHTNALTHTSNSNEVIGLKAKHAVLVERLNQLNTHAKTITYDQSAHEKLVKELKELDAQLQNQDAIKQQHAWQNERKNTFLQLCARLKEYKKSLHNLTAELAHYQPLMQLRATLLTQELNTRGQLNHAMQDKERLLQEKGRLESEQTKLARIASEHAQQQHAISSLDEQIQDYQAIAQAASKDGIQALLIEDAIPEIEQEANNLLSKLTNNQSHISIESLRDLKGGGTKETLDINISDTVGIRPYEMFSGGEAFRIDFALRIAISKLLARRAGTALQTLIIDEGFGSQDEEGLNHIMDAMYKIQDDFAKVIIVSHLASMKDQFPVHFVIEKNARGSMVHVIEQG